MLSHTHLGTCGSGSGTVCHSLFQESRKTKDEASNAMKIQMSPRSQHEAKTAIYQQPPLKSRHPAHDQSHHQVIHLHTTSCQSGPGHSAIGAFARRERELWHLPKGLPEGSWRGSRMERKRLHYRQTGGNPGNSQKPQHNQQKDPG